jgi:SM-20-related protein
MELQDTTAASPTPAPYDAIAEALLRRGWSVTEGFLPPPQVALLRAEALRTIRAGGFRHAGIGRGESFEVKPEVRNDWVRWVDPATAGPAQQDYLARMEVLRLALNRQLALGLFTFECHFAVYPAGSRYRKHLDQFRGAGLRTLSCILYLNRNWRPEDGGQLRIYTDPDDPGRCEELMPLGGRLVSFLSAEYLHEVLPARRRRLSLTGWFKRRGAESW